MISIIDAYHVSAVTIYETRIVLGGRAPEALDVFERLLSVTRHTIIPFDAAAARAAHKAYQRWSKGSGTGAKLNLGDCAAYALAIGLDVPLLFKGDDFGRTDVRPALA